MAVALGVFSGRAFYTVSWLGERVTADLRNAVYSHVLRQSPSSLRPRRPAKCCPSDHRHHAGADGGGLVARMGLRNAVLGVGALAMLVFTNPW